MTGAQYLPFAFQEQRKKQQPQLPQKQRRQHNCGPPDPHQEGKHDQPKDEGKKMSHATPELRKRHVKILWIIGASFIAGALLFLLAVTLMAPCWHIIHGDFISYDEWTIRVPDHFFVRGDGVMWRLNPGTPLFTVPYGHISLFRNAKTVDLPRGYPLFESAIVAEGMKSGLQVESRRTINIGGHEGRCLQMSRSIGGTPILVRCIIADDSTLVFYEGYPQYVSQFFSMMQGMSKNSH
jgi:hypothetical protein